MKKSINPYLATTTGLLAIIAMAASPASAQSSSSSGAVGQKSSSSTTNSGGFWGNPTPLLNQVAGKLNLTANVGVVYNFASNWTSSDDTNGTIGQGKQNAAPAYGANLGWTSKTGFGLSADYLGFASSWQNISGGTQYDAQYNAVTFTPSYRFSFGQNREWGLRLGLGLGFSLADVKWASGAGSANGASTNGINWGTPAAKRSAGGASYNFNPINLYWNVGMSPGNTGYHDLTYPGSFGLDNLTPIIVGTAIDLNITDADLATNHAGMGAISLTALCGAGVDLTKVIRFADANSTAGNGVCVGNMIAPNLGSAAVSTATDVKLGRYLYGVGLTAAKLTSLKTLGGESGPVTGGGTTPTVVATRVPCTAWNSDGTPLTPSGCNVGSDNKVVDASQKNRQFTVGVGSTDLTVSQTVIDTIKGLENANGMLAGTLTGTALASALTGNINAVLWSTALTMADDSGKMNRVATAINNAVAAGSIIAPSADKVMISADVWNQLTPAAQNAIRAAGGATDATTASSGSAKDDAGVIIAPQVAVEYDNGLFHGDLSIRYIHELVGVNFNGQNGSADQKQSAGPLALFLGAGFGFNF